MNVQRRAQYRYHAYQYRYAKYRWTRDPTNRDRLVTLAWANYEYELMGERYGHLGAPVSFPTDFYDYLQHTSSEVLQAIPIPTLMEAIGWDEGMLRRFGLNRDWPLAIYAEKSDGQYEGSSYFVVYSGGNR